LATATGSGGGDGGMAEAEGVEWNGRVETERDAKRRELILGPEATGSSGLEKKADAYWAGVDEWIGLVTDFFFVFS
jgi:hypothetical protein